jgi:hypothetical protein
LKFPLSPFFALFAPVFTRDSLHRHRYAPHPGQKMEQKILKNSVGGKIKTSSKNYESGKRTVFA